VREDELEDRASIRERCALMSSALVGEKAATPASVVAKYFPRASWICCQWLECHGWVG
jgi:hypothetical protein